MWLVADGPDPMTMTLQYPCRLLVARLQWTGWLVIVNSSTTLSTKDRSLLCLLPFSNQFQTPPLPGTKGTKRNRCQGFAFDSFFAFPGGEVKLWTVVLPIWVLVPTRVPDGVVTMVMFVLPTFWVMAEKDPCPDDPVVT